MKSDLSQYRLGSGPARIPWRAVSEKVAAADLMRVLEFLLPPPAGDTRTYRARRRELREALDALAACAGRAGNLTLGANVRQLEAQCCRQLGVKHACFLTNATAAFEIAHQLAGLGPGDEVIVPAITYVATMAYPLAVGARLVIADVDPHTLNLDPADVARKVTGNTRVVIPVHLGGYPVDMAPLMRLARQHGFIVLEDAAHAFGGSYRGRALGSIGDFGAFSFHQVKNMTSFGEGGLLISNRAVGRTFPQCRLLGIDSSRRAADWLYDVDAVDTLDGGLAVPGNHSSTEIQAIGLMCQIARFPRILRQRRAAATYLTKRLNGIPGILPQPLDTAACQATYMMYLLQVDPEVLGSDIQALKKKLAARGVSQIPHFVPLYHFAMLKRLGYDTDAMRRSCPVAERAYRHCFTHLPIANLKRHDLRYMADAIVASVRELKAGR